MQNKWNSAFQGFIPVSGNWDFTPGNEGCATRGNRRRNAQSCQENVTAASVACAQETKTCTRAANCGSDDCTAARSKVCETYAAPCNEYQAVQTACSHPVNCGCDACAATQQKKGCETRPTSRQLACNEYQTAQTTCVHSANCGCEACAAARQGTCESYPTSCQTAYNECQTAQNSCNSCNGCSTPCAQAIPATGRNQGVGIVWGQEQQLDRLYDFGGALRAGTLFPELHKPLNGYCPPNTNCATRDQAMSFTAWELRLYLDTHPDDAQALALLNQLETQLADPNYATTFLPEGSNWTWTNDPWPWNFNCRCGD